tara:strand:- start:399 stop:1190 length:792 start_codon:yes stop_codon:yes gene_type:complete
MIRITNPLIFLLAGIYALTGATATHANALAEKYEIAGRYAHYDIVAYTDSLFGPFKMKTLIISYGLTDFTVEGDEVISTDKFCFSEHKANIPFSTSVSDTFTQAIVPKPTPIIMSEVNDKLKVYRPETPTLLGVELDSHLTPFPEDLDDSRYVDADDDGKPGVTVKLSFLRGLIEEEIYIARKEIFAYDMELQDDGSFVGQVYDRSQQRVIGASKKALAKDNNPPQDSDISKSPIILIPVAEDFDCTSLKSARNELFPPNPKP